MSRTIRTCLTLLFLFSTPALIYAQTTQAKDAPATNASSTKKTSATRGEANALAEQRRITALSLLTSLADEAKGYHDQSLRARGIVGPPGKPLGIAWRVGNFAQG